MCIPGWENGLEVLISGTACAVYCLHKCLALKHQPPEPTHMAAASPEKAAAARGGWGGSFSWRSLTAVDMKVKETLPPPTPSCSISRGFYSPHAVSCVSRRIDVQYVAPLPTCRYSRSVIFFGLSMIDEMLKNGRPYFPDSQWGLLFSCSLLTQTLKPLNGLSIDLQEKWTSIIRRFHCKCPPLLHSVIWDTGAPQNWFTGQRIQLLHDCSESFQHCNWKSLFLTSMCAHFLSSASRQLWRLSARPGLRESTRETTSESFSVVTATRRTRPLPRLSPSGALKRTTAAANWTRTATPSARSRDPAPLGLHPADGRRRSWNW